MLKNKLFIASTILATALIFSACNLYKTPSTGQNNQNQAPVSGAAEAKPEVTITYSDSGFDSGAVVNSGGKIIWKNASSTTVAVASDPHPVHTGNPELTGNQFVMNLAPGASQTVTVTKTGTFGYHNHLSTSQRGSVTVK